MYDLTLPMGQMNYMSLMPSMGLTSNYANNVIGQDMLTNAGYDNSIMGASAMNYGGNPYGFTMPPCAASTASGGASTGTLASNSFFNPDYMYNYMDKNQDYMINYGIKQQTKMRNADMQVASPVESVALAGKVLHDKILADEQDQIKKAYNDYCARVEALYGGNVDKEALRARADLLYQQLTGKSISQDLKEHGRSEFTQAFVNALTLGISNKRSAAENANYITGAEEGRMEKMHRTAGRIAGGATVGAAATVTTWGALKLLTPKLFKNKPIIGLIVGAIAGFFAAKGRDH